MDAIDPKTGIARLEAQDRSCITVPLASLPQGVRQGDLLLGQNGEYLPDPQGTALQKQKVQSLFDRLKKAP